MKTLLSLSAQGDTMSLQCWEAEKKAFRDATSDDELHDALKRVLDRKTQGYDAVLSVLKEIKTNSADIKDLATLHVNSRYKGHECQKGIETPHIGHIDSIDDLIVFVEERIKNRDKYEAGYLYQVNKWSLEGFKRWCKLDTSNKDVQAGIEDVKQKHHNRYIPNI